MTVPLSNIETEDSGNLSSDPLRSNVEEVQTSVDEEAGKEGHSATDSSTATPDDDDDETVIVLDPNTATDGRTSGRNAATFDWMGGGDGGLDERRRGMLLRELRRVQRSSFLHFAVLCVIPTVLLLVVIVTVLGGVEECDSHGSLCYLEERNFMNAFTTRCVCESIPIPRESP